MMGNEKKTAQLGMSFSKASGQLKKMVLLQLLQRLGEDDCYRCGEKIETIEDLSIEHKIAWLDKPNAVELFWDLENIAHSHLKCNSRASRPHGKFGVIPREVRQENRRRQIAADPVKFREVQRAGGRARWNLTDEERSELGRKMAHARWHGREV